MVSLAGHIPGHAASYTARLKEEVYAIRHPGDLFYPFVVEIFWGASPGLGSIPSILGDPLRGVAVVLPRSQWLRPFLGNGSRWRCNELRPSRSNGERRQLDLEHLDMFLSWTCL
ncbi:unnamed protein product [Calypogeia fissa]